MVLCKYHKTINCVILALLIIFALVPFATIQTASAATSLTLKWTGYVAGGGEALLTADVRSDIPGEEVFHAGGPVAPNSGGRVTCLNGRTGAQIWTRTIPNIGDTCQPQMVDMDHNGDLEIVVPLQQPAGLYILHAENGETMFSVTNVGGGRIDSSAVAGDVDKNGYPDLFVGVMGYEEVEPINGKVIRYEWNPATGNVVERDRVTVWHPCAGGLSLCDTDNDGRIELYMNERDVYFGDGSWGRGVTSFWADTLDVRWRLYDWGASSNIPMLADVNKDGIVDVVTTDLSAGVCVLNSTDGQPLTNAAGTTLYQTRIPGRHNHYQSSVYDIDRDGNLEILSGDGFEGQFDFVTAFDLWNWKLDASIDTTIVGGRSWKGPTVGEVTGDGQMDIIVVTFDHINNSNNGTVQVYDRNYNLIYVNTGLRHRAIESVVQDIDRNDGGLNELLVLTQGGVIYCFETPGIASSPRARSEVQFYSESRLGASEYLAYERPVTHPPPIDPNPPANAAPTQTTPSLSGTTDSDNLVVTPQGTYDADGDRVTNIYNWQKNGFSLTNINLPFETKTNPQDEYSGLAISRDYAYGAYGSVFGATWTPNGKVGGAYSFNGNDFIRVEESSNRYDGGGSWPAMSLECWVKVSSTSNERLILKTDRYDTRAIISYRLDCQNQGSQLLFSWNASGRTPVLYGSVSSRVNDWHHVVCTYSSGIGSKFYIDGILANNSLSTSFTGNILDTNGPFEIAFGSGSDLVGSVDEVRLYPYEISASMVAQRFADTKDGLSTSSTINSADTSVGEQWRCQVTPNDGKVDGDTANTATRTIVAGSGYSLTVNTVGSGSVTKNPNATSYSPGTVVSLTAIPASGWNFSGWSGDLSGVTNPTTITMTGSKVVTATFTQKPSTDCNLTINIIGNGSVAKNPNQAAYVPGTIVTLNAAPGAGWSFSGWSGDLTGTTNPITITMTNNKNVTATFTQNPPAEYNLTINVVGSGSVTKNPNRATYAMGTNVSLSAIPASGWNFSGWSGDLSGTANPTSIIMSSNKVVTATFKEVSTGHILFDDFESGSLAAWNGRNNRVSVSSLGTPYHGTYHLACNLASAANNQWSGAYKSITGTNPVYLNAFVRFDAPPNTNNEDQWVLCFSQNPSANALAYAGIRQVSGNLYWSIWYISSGNTLSYNISSIPYRTGWHNLQLAIYRGTTNNGWVEFYVDGALVASAYNLDNDGRTLSYARVGFSYADAPSAASSVVYVDDVAIDSSTTPPPPPQYYLTVNNIGNGSVTKNPNQNAYASGSTVQLTAVPAIGWKFSGWSGDLTGTTNPVTITMNGNKNITAAFQEIATTQYSLTVNTVGNGSVSKNPNQATYASGSSVVLTAIPANGYMFTGWSGDLTGTTNPATVIMNSNKSITANFATTMPTKYTLSVNVIGNGSVTKNPNLASYDSGSSVSLTAIPATGYTFSGWSGDLSGTTNPNSIIMSSNKTVTATFKGSSQEHLFADDFESGTLSAWDGQDGTTTVSSAKPYQGTYHLSSRLSSGANNGWAGVYKNLSGANPVYLNAYVNFNAPPNTENEDQWALAFTQSTAGNALGYAGIRQVNGNLYWAIWYLSTGTTLTYNVSGIIYTPGWHALSLAVYRGTANNGWVELYVDGALVASAYNLDNDGRTLSYARVGFSYADAPSAASSIIYIDNVTIDSSKPPI